MEQVPRIQCKIIDDGVPIVEASTFRLSEEVADTFFLDFIGPEDQGLVMRLRLQKVMLSSVRDRLATDVFFCPSRMVH